MAHEARRRRAAPAPRKAADLAPHRTAAVVAAPVRAPRALAAARSGLLSRPLIGDLLALGGLLLLVALFFWRLWTPNPADRVAIPVGDFTHQYYPLRRFVAGMLAEGQLPFWNPWIFGGQPGLADPQAGALYPPAVLNALLWGAAYPLLALELEVMAHLLIAAWGTYLFVRWALGLAPLPALTGAIIFGFGGYLTGFPVEQVTILECAAWLPWLLLTIHHAAAPPGEANAMRRQVGWAALAAIIFALALLAGHPQTALYLGYAALVYALFRLGRPWPAWRGWLARALPVALAFPLGVALAAAQLLPTQAFIAESSRSSLSFEFTQTGLRWEELLTLLLPQLVGSNPLYLGIGALTLLLVAALSGMGAARRFWLAMALVSVLLALGGNSFFFDLAYLGVPGIARVRSQERVLLLFAWGIALLAAWGMATLQRLCTPSEADAGEAEHQSLRERLAQAVSFIGRWLPLLGVPVVALWWLRVMLLSGLQLNGDIFDALAGGYLFFLVMVVLYWALLRWSVGGRAGLGVRLRQATPLLLVALLLFELFSANRDTHTGLSPEETLPVPTELVAALQGAVAEAPGRVAVVENGRFGGNDGMRWGLELLTGNGPLRLSRPKDVLNKVESWRLFQLFNVGYVVAPRDLAAESPELYEPLAQFEEVYAVRLRAPSPRAWLVGQAEVLDGGDAIRDRLNDPTFDPAQAILVDETNFPLAGRPVAGQVTIEAQAPGLLRLRATTPADAALVMAEPLARGWQATLNGAPARLHRANLIHNTLPLPAGEHQVELRYEQPGWREGVRLSAVALLLATSALLWGFSGRGRRP